MKMRRLALRLPRSAFSLVEVVLAMGIVSFSVLATVGLLSVASDTNRRSRDETFAAQLAANEFERLRSLGASSNFWPQPSGVPTHQPKYFDSNLAEVENRSDPQAVYELALEIVELNPPAPADFIFNAEVRYPATAANPTKVLFTTLMNRPKP